MHEEKAAMKQPASGQRRRSLRLYGIPAVIVISTLAAIALVLSVSERGAAEEGSAPAASTATGPAKVELKPEQLKAITIATVATYRFTVEKHAPGSISFEEDPAVVQAESALVSAAAAYQLANKELIRENGLGTTNGIPQKQLEQALSDKQTAEAALNAARQSVRALGRTDAQIDAMVASGSIEQVPAGGESDRWVIAYAAETDSLAMRPGQPVRISVAALPDREFDGVLAKVYGAIDPDTHRVTLRCRITDPDHELKPGMLADVYVQTQKPVESVALPDDGVVREGDGTMTAWVTSDGQHFAQRVLTTGLEQDGKTQILQGLKAGERAVVQGAVFLDNMIQAPSDD